MPTRLPIRLLAIAGLLALAAPAAGETLCDPAYQDCRTPLLSLINNETVGIDVAFWFMQDTRYESALLNRWRAGVPIRVLVDPRANPTYAGNAQVIADLAAAGIPIRYRLPSTAGILHWKMMLFAGQNQVEFDGANFSPTAFIYQTPYSDYEWESIYFSDDPLIVNSFKTEYDNLWLDTTNYGNYANVNGQLARIYPIYPKDSGLNFPQQEDYAARILRLYSAETQAIDVIMYRITDERHTNAMIAAMQRGIPVRIISDTFEYRDPTRLWVAYNLDKLYAAGVPLKVRGGLGLNHQKLVILYNQATAVFGSSNWTTPSANQQQEHNYFTTKPWMFQWFTDQFDRKWNNLAPNGAIESAPFVPLPPDTPAYLAPASGAVGVDRSLELRWNGGPWGQLYDIYFGTDPNPPLLAANQKLGPTDPAIPSATQKWILPLLQPGTTYYWRIVSKTMAGLSRTGQTFSFTTAGAPPPVTPPSGSNTIVIWAATNVPAANIVGNWQFLTDSTAAGGRALWNPDHGLAKVSPPLAAPANYFTTTFNALGGVAYHVWVRLRAQSNSTSNNSVTFQFNDSIDQFSTPLYRIGTAAGGETILSDPSGTLNNWGWADNGRGGAATLVYFPASGQHTIQVQQRTDGAIVDQIILSPDVFINSPPGTTLNDATIYGSTIDGAAPPPAPPVVPVPPPIPGPWQQRDIGGVGMPGYSSFDNGASVFTDEAAGADIWGNADSLHFIYQPLNGDGTIVARVAALQNTNVWTKAGVMIRQDLTPGSVNAFMLVSAAKGTYWQSRVAANGATTNAAGAVKTAPYWVKLTRTGTTFTAAESPDGATWTTVTSASLSMTGSTFIGLALTSHNVDATAVASFDNVSINGVPVCGYGVSPLSQSVGAGGGTATLNLTTGPSCAWTASSAANWLTIQGNASGTGSASIPIGVAANTGSTRVGTVSVGSQPFTVIQDSSSCSFAISPVSQSFAAAGGTATIAVSTASWCSWTAASNVSWMTVSSGASGTGSGSVSLSVAANTGAMRSGTATLAGQTFTASQQAPPAGLPAGWSNQDIGSVGLAGASRFDQPTGTFTVTGAGADVWGTADALQFAYTPLTGDGSIVARVASVQNTNAWTKAGVMIRGTVDPGSAQGFMLVSFSKGLAYQRRLTNSGSSISTAGPNGIAPYWVRLDRIGNMVTSYQSTDGVAWSFVDSDTLGLPATILVGLGVSSHSTSATATSTFDNVTVTPGTPASPTPLPTGWGHADIGSVGIAGAAAFNASNLTFDVKGAGADIWNSADAFHFAYKPLTGDGVIVARVASLQNTNVWAKAGVMIREALAPGATEASMLVSPGKGLTFQRRTSTGGVTTNTAGALVAAPYWVKLERVGSTFNAYSSPDGTAWALVGTDTISMGAAVYVGLGVSSHTTTAAALAVFDHVTVP